MDVVDRWTGRRAGALRAAMRLTVEQFASMLGAGVRTVASWDAKPDLVLSAAMQEVLDAAFEKADGPVRQRFVLLQADATDGLGRPQVLTVSIAVVIRGSDVLLVCRRDDAGTGITWQFPAGVVKPNGDPARVAVRETFLETGVHASVRASVGSRLHPVTGAYCHYFVCDYLAGEARNLDQAENDSVDWIPRSRIDRFIPLDRLYGRVLGYLAEDSADEAS